MISDNAASFSHSAAKTADWEQVFTIVEAFVLRYGLALVLLWIGAMKFTSYEANGIRPLEANSPFLRPLLHILGTQNLSDLVGSTEIVTALLLIVGQFMPRLGVIGGLLGMGIFLTTLTFLFSTPGWEASLGGFPSLSAGVGQFLLKDVVLLGAAVYSVREGITKARQS